MNKHSFASTQSLVIAELSAKPHLASHTFPKKKLPKIFSLGYGSTPIFKSLKRTTSGLFETDIDPRTLELLIHKPHKDFFESFKASMLNLYHHLLK